jgi:hypothetical protein
VFQTPALKWRFERGETSTEFSAITPTSIYDAFEIDATAPILG